MKKNYLTDRLLLPDFLIIGAGKSGTTSVNNYLKQHPQIFVSPVKEPNFFGYELKSRGDFKAHDELRHYLNSVTRIEDYVELFRGAEFNQIKGETSNTYLYHEDAPLRIHHYIPGVKLIAIFRQPAERLYSRFLHLAREKKLPSEKFEDCLDKTSIWWRRNDLVKEGFYYQNLSKYYERFSSDQIKVFLYEDLQSNPGKLFKEIFRFLNVSENFTLDTSIQYNKSGYIKNPIYDKLFGQRSILKRPVKHLLSDENFKRLRSNRWLQKKLSIIRGLNLYRPELDPALKKQITQEIYAKDILMLERLTKRDLNHWL